MKRISASLGVAAIACTVALTIFAVAPLAAQDWPMFGQNVANTANNSARISTATVSTLLPKWTFTTGGDVSARAAVVNSIAYFPDWGAPGQSSNLWAVNAVSGQLVWGHTLSDYGLPTGTHSRTSPALNDNGSTLYLGTQEGAWLLAINARTGALIWKMQLDNDPFAIDTTSPAIYQNVVFTGVASVIEGGSIYGINNIAGDPNARGSVVALNAMTGAILWKTYTVPTGYLGGGVWGSNPVVDASRNTVYVGTGNNYVAPNDPAYTACIAGGGTPASCQSPNNHADSIVALNMTTGAIKWATRLENWNQTSPPYPYPFANGADFWNVDCAIGFSQCPQNPGPDYDFGSAPNEITYTGSDRKAHTIIGAGQKSGIYYALNPDTGATLWQTQVGPGSSLGGMEWGSASDGTRIYVQITNLYGIPYTAGSAGSWSALDPATGAIVWQTPDPNMSVALGPVAVGNGVVYGESMSSAANAPTMLALDASTGHVLWSYAAGSSVIAGATVVQNSVFWGSGYSHFGPFYPFTGNNRFYAFTPNGQ